MRTIKFLTLLIVLINVTKLNGQADSTDITNSSMFTMDLSDILNVNVSSATKTKEKISEASSVITAHTDKEIKHYGYYTLKDLANVTAGFSTLSTYGETNLETRGQIAGSWNVSKHLLLIDGIPFNHARANSAQLEMQVPLFFAEKVEFLKGPNSALYGTSAFYGVIDINSKTLTQNGTDGKLRLTYGDRGDSKTIMGVTNNKTDDGEFKIMFSTYDRQFSGDMLGINQDLEAMDNDESHFINASYKLTTGNILDGLKLGTIYSKRESHGGEFWGVVPSPVNNLTFEQIVPYVKYEKDLNDKYSMNSYVKYNSSTEKSGYGASWASFDVSSIPYNGYSFTTENIEGLAELKYSIDESNNAIVGVNFDTRKQLASPVSYQWRLMTTPDTNITKEYSFEKIDYGGSERVNIYSAYGQYKTTIDFLEGTNLTFGGRIDKGVSVAGTYSQYSPRIAAVQKITDKFNGKLMYGKALRVPGIFELTLNAETIESIQNNGGTGDVNDILDVGAEIIESFEGVLTYQDKKVYASLAMFMNKTTNALESTRYDYIDSENQALSANYFTNVDGDITANGLELELKYLMNNLDIVSFNHAYASAHIYDTIRAIMVPTQKTNFIFTHRICEGKFNMLTTLIVRHMWGMKVDPNVYGYSITPDYTVVDVNFVIPVTSKFDVELMVRNLTNSEWLQPSLLGTGSMIPIQSRNFLITTAFKF